MKILAIQKLYNVYNMLIIVNPDSSKPSLILQRDVQGVDDIYESVRYKIDSEVKMRKMTDFMNEMIELFSNGTRKPDYSGCKWLISEFMTIYLKHGYNTSILCRHELEKAQKEWSKALGAKIKENDGRFVNTNYSSWEYRYNNIEVYLPYVLEYSTKTINDFQAEVLCRKTDTKSVITSFEELESFVNKISD